MISALKWSKHIRNLITVSVSSLVILAAAGCGMFSGHKEEAAEAEKTAAADSAAKAREAGEKILDNILKGLEKSDYSIFAKNFAE